MRRTALWKLCGIIAAGTVSLFWAVDILTQQTEFRMSFIAEEHQQQLLDYGEQAEHIYIHEGPQAAGHWLNELQEREQTWAAIATAEITPLAGSQLSQRYMDGFSLGRDVSWKIHLYFKDNPIMDIPFSDGEMHFLIQLPQRMRPGAYLVYIDIFLQVALPLVILSLVALALYQHLVTPLRKLQSATRQLGEGNFGARVTAGLSGRSDEIGDLANTFDQAAARMGTLFNEQRELLAYLSHELRAPLTRMDMAVDCVEHKLEPRQALQRLRQESTTMRTMVEDALTLVWLNSEKPRIEEESFDLADLLQVICDDARYEYPGREVLSDWPDSAVIHRSNQRALSHSLENIVRNALRHTPESSPVHVSLKTTESAFVICVKDHGRGFRSNIWTISSNLSSASSQHKTPRTTNRRSEDLA